MLSTSQLEIAKSLIPTVCKDYPYYILYTNEGYHGKDTPDLYIYFSKDPIKQNTNRVYMVPSGSLKYDIISRSADPGESSRPRISCGSVGSQTLVNVSPTEFIYTNSVTGEGLVIQPDILVQGGELNVYTKAISFSLLACFVAVLCVHTFNIVTDRIRHWGDRSN